MVAGSYAAARGHVNSPLVLRAQLTTRWSAEAWPQVKTEFKKALALRSQIRRAGWFN